MPEILPKPKPKQFTKILDMLNTKAAANQFSTKTYTDLVLEFSKKAYDNNELSDEEYADIVEPLKGDTGIMLLKQIQKEKDELNKYANGGRIGLRGGGMDMGNESNQSQSANMGSGTTGDFSNETQNTNHNNRNDNSNYDYGAEKQIAKQIAINTAKNVGGKKLAGFLGLSQYSNPFGVAMALKGLYNQIQNPNIEEEEETSGIASATYADGGRIGFLDGGDTAYNKMVTEAYIKAGGFDATGMDIDTFAEEYFKKFNQGGRVNYNEGSPDTGKIRDKVIEIMDAEGLDFGEAFKLAMKELNREANSSND